jgi:signal transduction histidine kinase
MTEENSQGPDIESSGPERRRAGAGINPALERLTDLERRSLLAEQARRQAHQMRTPLSVIELIAETMQLESQADERHAERLGRIKAATGELATELSAAVSSTRFGEDARRSRDPAGLAAEVVSTFGGEVATGAAQVPQATLLVDPASFEAALVHALRLVGVGTDCNGVCAQRPVLRVERREGELLLIITARGAKPADTPRERGDLRLMAQAAERAARDHGGRLYLAPDSATFRFPLPSETSQQWL